jgi:hypothetical protein
MHDIILLQWIVVDGFQRCNLKLLFRQTCLSSPDSQPLQAIQLATRQKKIKKTLTLTKEKQFND